MFWGKILDWSFTTNYMYICYSTQCTFIFSILVRLNVTSKLSKTSFEMNVIHKTKKTIRSSITFNRGIKI